MAGYGISQTPYRTYCFLSRLKLSNTCDTIWPPVLIYYIAENSLTDCVLLPGLDRLPFQNCCEIILKVQDNLTSLYFPLFLNKDFEVLWSKHKLRTLVSSLFYPRIIVIYKSICPSPSSYF